MEFEITTDLSLLKNQQIDANFAAVSAWLDEELAPYNGMIVTADMIPAAKNYRASLRKVKERIEQYRKEAKNAALAPYNLFEQKCKELTAKIDDAANNIDVQVKDFERQEADAKIADIKQTYDTFKNREACDYLDWDRVFNPKWANKTYSAVDAKTEIIEALKQTERDISAIRSMGGDNTAYLLDCYRQTHDISSVIRKNAEINARRAIEEQRKQEAEELRKAQETEARQAQNEKNEAQAGKPQEQSFSPAVTTDLKQDDLITTVFRVTCTKGQLLDLGQYMRQNGIKYGRA